MSDVRWERYPLAEEPMSLFELQAWLGHRWAASVDPPPTRAPTHLHTYNRGKKSGELLDRPRHLVHMHNETRESTLAPARRSTSATRSTRSSGTTRPARTWVFDPDSGGKPIPEPVKRRTEERLRRYAEQHFAGRYTRLDIRFRGQFCYVDAFTEPEPPTTSWPPPDWPETREEYVERLRNTPTHLCRLRYFGDEERWGFAFYTYSHERYELSVFPSGEFFGPPEEAFHVSAEMYLR